jgi:hypothetical protein
MKVGFESPIERYRRLCTELDEAKGQHTQTRSQPWGPTQTTHTALRSNAVLTRHLQRMAKLEDAIRKLELELFPDGVAPTNEALFPLPGPVSEDGPKSIAVRTISPSAIAVSFATFLDFAAGRVRIADNGHTPLRGEPITIDLGGRECRIEPAGRTLRVVTPDAAFEVIDRAPCAWILKDANSTSYQVLEWDVPLSAGALKQMKPESLHALPHRPDEPAFCAIGSDGPTFIFDNGFAFDRKGRAGWIDTRQRERCTWVLEHRSRLPYSPSYDDPEARRYGSGTFAYSIRDPWKARLVPIEIDGERAFQIAGPSRWGPLDPIAFRGKIYSDARMLDDGTRVLLTDDGDVLCAEAGRMRVPAEGERMGGGPLFGPGPSGAREYWVEGGKLCHGKPVRADGLDPLVTLVLQGHADAKRRPLPIRLEQEGEPIQNGVFSVGRWTVQARDGHQDFWYAARESSEGRLCIRVSLEADDPEILFLGAEGPREGPVPSSLAGGNDRECILMGGHLHAVLEKDGDRMMTQRLSLLGDVLEPEGAVCLFHRSASEWVPSSSGIVKPKDPTKQRSILWFRGEPYAIDGAKAEGVFRIFKSGNPPEHHVVRRVGDDIRLVEDPVPGLQARHDGVLCPVAIPLEDVNVAADRFERLFRDVSPADQTHSRLGLAVFERARALVSGGAATIQDLRAALRRGDDALVGGPHGLTGRELRRGIGFIEDAPFSVLVRPIPLTHDEEQSATRGTDGLRMFPGAPDALVIVDSRGEEATSRALASFFDRRVKSLEALSQLRATTVRARLEEDVEGAGGQRRLSFEWDGGRHSVPVESEGPLSEEAASFLVRRLSEVSPKLIQGLAKLECTRLPVMANMNDRGRMQFDPKAVGQHRASVVDHELIHGQTYGDRELQLLAAIAVKLGPPPEDQYADSLVEEILTVHWQRLVENPGGVLGKNPYLDRLALAVAGDPDFGPMKMREALEARAALAL